MAALCHPTGTTVQGQDRPVSTHHYRQQSSSIDDILSVFHKVAQQHFLRCRVISNDHYITNLLLSVPTKEFLKLVNIWQKYGYGSLFATHSVQNHYMTA